MRIMRILTFTTLYPNQIQQNHGLFVEQRLSSFLNYQANYLAKVIAPVPWFPWRSSRFGQYSKYAAIPPHETRKGIDIVHPRFFHIPRMSMSISPFLLAMSSMRAIRRLLASGWKFDVIDAHYFYPDGVAAALLARHFKKPLVITARGSDVNVFPAYRIPRRMIQWAARESAAIIAVSESLRQSLVDLGVSANAVTNIGNGVNLDLFKPLDKNEARANLRIPDNSRLIISVGNLVELKGHELLIRAMREIPADVVLTILGEGPLKSEYRKLIADLGMMDRVSLAGSVPQELLPQYYSAADALVHASSNEGIANVWLEALACGTGVVTSAVGGAPEIISNDFVGHLIPERTPAAIAEAVTAYLAKTVSKKEIRNYARRFSWEMSSAQQADVFERVTAISPESMLNQI